MRFQDDLSLHKEVRGKERREERREGGRYGKRRYQGRRKNEVRVGTSECGGRERGRGG